MKHSLSALLTLSLAAALTGQAGPGYTRLATPSWIIINSFTSVPGNNISQVFHAKLSNNVAAEWTTTLSIGGLPPFYGGNNVNTGVGLGTFMPYAGTFTMLSEAAALNQPSVHNQNLNLSPDGLWAILERVDPMTGAWLGVFVSQRSAVGAAFPAPVAVSGFSSTKPVYPALGPIGGQMKCFYTDHNNILMQDIDLANATLVGSPVIVSSEVQAGAKPFAPTPLIGADGDVEGVMHSEEVRAKTGPFTGEADMSWNADLDPTTPGTLIAQPNPDWQCCGGVAGGFTYFSHDVLPRWHVMHSEGAWMLGDDEPIGGNADISMTSVYYGQFSSPVQPLFLSLFVAGIEAPPVSLPPIVGQLGIDAGSLLHIVTLSTTNPDGDAKLTFPIPNNLFLKGKKIALQAVASDLARNTHIFTNSAWLQMR